MDEGLRDLYQEVILDHSKRPRNFREVEEANHEAKGYNPLCGDKISVFLRVEGGTIQDVGFQGTGCAISTASASMMTEILKGKTEEEVKILFRSFHQLVTGKSAAGEAPAKLGKLAVFAGVQEFPVRVKCATLAWHTLQAALQNKTEAVSTE
ncbi:MAG: Fe-S cluster assembly sulfur transfer protein SufU [Acidobacteriota bacterium]